MSKRFWTGDFHLGGNGISEYASRPFKNAEDMNKRLISNSNMRVKQEDTVVNVGDFASYGAEKGKEGLRIKPSEYLKQLNGKWIMIEGNHCENNRVKTDMKFMFTTIGKHKVFVSHYPTDSLNNKIIDVKFWDELVKFAVNNTSFALVGHVHDAWHWKICKDYGRDYLNINVGVDVNRYMPISDDEVMKLYEKIKKENK